MLFLPQKACPFLRPATQQPALRCSICTGGAGGRFHLPRMAILRTFSSFARLRNWTHSGHGTASRRNAPLKKIYLKGVRHAHCT